MSLEDAFAPAEAAYKKQVMITTWGHLAPKPSKKYPGTILFTHGEYGDIVVIRDNFAGLPNSPWFFEDMNEYIGNCVCSRGLVHLPEGGIYQFVGTYVKFKNGKYRFSGKIREITSIPPTKKATR